MTLEDFCDVEEAIMVAQDYQFAVDVLEREAQTAEAEYKEALRGAQ